MSPRNRELVDAREHGGGIERWTVAYVPSAGSLRVREEGGRVVARREVAPHGKLSAV